MPFLPRLLLLLGLTLSVQADPLLIEYRDKPPYSYTENNQPMGFLMKRTAEIFKLAGVEVSYLEVPVKRILGDLQADQAALCSPSWYKLAEREKFARYSLPIHKDKPHVVMANPQAAPTIRAHKRLAELFADPYLTAGVLDGVSYGAELDQALAALPRPAVKARMTPLQLAKMIGARRADYMLMDQEDVEWMMKSEEFAELKLVRFEFPDMPEGLLRYLLCSKQVDDKTMERINLAIKRVVPDLR